MDTTAVKQAIKDLIENNESTLVSGLAMQGVSRKIHRLTTSTLTPLDGYYYIAILLPDTREQSRSEKATTTRRPTRMVDYDIQIIVIDEAHMRQSDKSMYEGMHEEFNTFTDRIVNLLEEQTWIDPSSLKLKLKRQPGEGDRAIRKLDVSGTSIDTEEQAWATLYSQINFTLVQECVNSS